MNKTVDDLIVKSLLEEISDEDEMVLKEWINSSSRNKKVYSELKGYWHIKEKDYGTKEEIWSELRFKTNEFNNGKQNESSSYKPFFLKVAAAVLLVCSSVFVTYQFLANDQSDGQATLIKKRCPVGAKLTVRLPDGSNVTLNSNSSIEYPNQFDQKIRYINLKGEAFFDVVSNPKQPLVVNTPKVQTTVLGTSFNVRAYPEDDMVKVALLTGKVAVKVKGQNEDGAMLLVPGEMVVYNKTEDTHIKTKFDEVKELGWKEGIIYFKGAGFREIKSTLEKWYGVNIVVSGTIHEDFHYTATYNNQSLNEVLRGMMFVQKFDYSIDGDTVKINF
ncbi:MAG: FecR family protein [Cyclobacteriaceae bacterium]